jgi:hypothetical protein
MAAEILFRRMIREVAGKDKPIPDKEFDKLIEQLGDNEFKTREAAEKELIKKATAADLKRMREIRDKTNDAEVRTRLRRILGKVEEKLKKEREEQAAARKKPLTQKEVAYITTLRDLAQQLKKGDAVRKRIVEMLKQIELEREGQEIKDAIDAIGEP